MAKHTPGAMWLFFKIRKKMDIGRLTQGVVKTVDRSTIACTLTFVIPAPKRGMASEGQVTLTLHREDARMLARRVNECLEATK